MKNLRSIGGLVLGLALFFISIELLGDAFKLFGKEKANEFLSAAKNPFVGLFIGILATTLAQSSSTITSSTVILVGTGAIPAAVAHPIVMGANIGTTVTNTIVSLAHIGDREEFKRAIGGATVHDFFNIIVVAVLFPLEMLTGYMDKISHVCAKAFQSFGGRELTSPLKEYFTGPISDFMIAQVDARMPASIKTWAVLIIAAAFLFFGLRILVMSLKALALDQADNAIEKYIFKASWASLIFGIFITILVQSSSVTTSLAVPFVATGALSVAQIFPYICGANIGTTCTALLTAFYLVSTGADMPDAEKLAVLVVALGHFFFNLTGVLIVFPIKLLRNIPVWLAERFGEIASRYRILAIVYTLVLFYAVPLGVIMIGRLF